jgi:hypothetical protein
MRLICAFLLTCILAAAANTIRFAADRPPPWTEADVAHDWFNLETILDQMNNPGATIKSAPPMRTQPRTSARHQAQRH